MIGSDSHLLHFLNVLGEELWNTLTEVQLGVRGKAFNGKFLQVLRSQLGLFRLNHLNHLVVVSVRLGHFFVKEDLVLDVLNFLLGLFCRYLPFHINLIHLCLCLSLYLCFHSGAFRN